MKPAPRLSTRTLPAPRGLPAPSCAECTFNPAKSWRAHVLGPLAAVRDARESKCPKSWQTLTHEFETTHDCSPRFSSAEAEKALYRPAPSPLTSGFPGAPRAAEGEPAIMAFLSSGAYLTHQQKVLRLYKRALRHLESWCIHRWEMGTQSAGR